MKKHLIGSTSSLSKSYSTSSSSSAIITKKLVIFDFDGVFTTNACHTHNNLMNANIVPFTYNSGLILNGEIYESNENLRKNKKYNPKTVKKHGDRMFNSNGLRDTEKLKNTIKKLWENDIDVVIASHNKFPAIIDYALEYIGFNKSEREKIDIICGFPINHKNMKNEHIQLAMQLHDITDFSEILFIDDSNNNCSNASKLGIDYILVNDFVITFSKIQNQLYPIESITYSGMEGESYYTNSCESEASLSGAESSEDLNYPQ